MREIVASLDEIQKVAEYLCDRLPADTILFLRGDVAAGKTTLTQAIAKAKGVANAVTSPTFSLQHCYGETLFHYDLYRLEDEVFMQMGLYEEFERSGWHIVEWGSDRLKRFLESVGYNVTLVLISPYKDGRKYTIEDTDADT